jgi:hypothetical protein
MAKISRIQRGRRVVTDEEARERGALILPPDALPPGVRRVAGKDLGRMVRPEMVSRRQRTCTGCSVSFTETVIHPAGDAPKPRDVDERPDLCANCFKKLSRFPIIGATRPRGRDVPRHI